MEVACPLLLMQDPKRWRALLPLAMQMVYVALVQDVLSRLGCQAIMERQLRHACLSSNSDAIACEEKLRSLGSVPAAWLFRTWGQT